MAEVREAQLKKGNFGEWDYTERYDGWADSFGEWETQANEFLTVEYTEELDGLIHNQDGGHVYRVYDDFVDENSFHYVIVWEID